MGYDTASDDEYTSAYEDLVYELTSLCLTFLLC
jgi:hypothetical protein